MKNKFLSDWNNFTDYLRMSYGLNYPEGVNILKLALICGDSEMHPRFIAEQFRKIYSQSELFEAFIANKKITPEDLIEALKYFNSYEEVNLFLSSRVKDKIAKALPDYLKEVKNPKDFIDNAKLTYPLLKTGFGYIVPDKYNISKKEGWNSLFTVIRKQVNNNMKMFQVVLLETVEALQKELNIKSGELQKYIENIIDLKGYFNSPSQK